MKPAAMSFAGNRPEWTNYIEHMRVLFNTLAQNLKEHEHEPKGSPFRKAGAAVAADLLNAMQKRSQDEFGPMYDSMSLRNFNQWVNEIKKNNK
jgi:hypothetical protein